MTTSSKERFDVYGAITDQIIASIEAGAEHPQMPWHRAGGSIERPTNVESKNAYRGVNTVALLTDMSVPLGLTAGNALEVRESVEVLAGGGPADVVELTVRLAEEMLDAAGRGGQDVAAALKDGRAMDAWKAMISAQGGDPHAPLPTLTSSTSAPVPSAIFLLMIELAMSGIASTVPVTSRSA